MKQKHFEIIINDKDIVIQSDDLYYATICERFHGIQTNITKDKDDSERTIINVCERIRADINTLSEMLEKWS